MTTVVHHFLLVFLFFLLSVYKQINPHKWKLLYATVLASAFDYIGHGLRVTSKTIKVLGWCYKMPLAQAHESFILFAGRGPPHSETTLNIARGMSTQNKLSTQGFYASSTCGTHDK